MKVKNWLFVVLVASCFIVLGCSQSPVPVSHQYSFQPKMQAAKHWQVLAQDVSNDVSQMFQMIEEEFPGTGAIHVKPVSIIKRESSSFSNALESFMLTDLTHLGAKVDNQADDAYQIYWSVQSVEHDAPRSFNRTPPGTFTAVGALGYGVYKIFRDSTRFAQAVTTGAVLDIASGFSQFAFQELPKNEVIVNITIQDGDDIIYRLSNIYYIKDLDKDHYHLTKDLYYDAKKAQTRTVNVRSKKDPHPIPYEDTFEVIFFQFDEYEIKEEYKDSLEKHVALLKEHPEIPVVIEGHTDSKGSEEYNLNLSQKRAEAVYDYFVQQNISADRLHKKGHAFFKPLAPNVTEDGRDNPEGRAKNRRAEIQWMVNQVVSN